jgi:hypothetical protein
MFVISKLVEQFGVTNALPLKLRLITYGGTDKKSPREQRCQRDP